MNNEKNNGFKFGQKLSKYTSTDIETFHFFFSFFMIRAVSENQLICKVFCIRLHLIECTFKTLLLEV